MIIAAIIRAAFPRKTGKIRLYSHPEAAYAMAVGANRCTLRADVEHQGAVYRRIPADGTRFANTIPYRWVGMPEAITVTTAEHRRTRTHRLEPDPRRGCGAAVVSRQQPVAAQLFTPVARQSIEFCSLDLVALPQGVVRILNG